MEVNRKFDFWRVWKFCWDLSNVISGGNWLFKWDCVFFKWDFVPLCELWAMSPKKYFQKLRFQKKDKKRVWPYLGDRIYNGGVKPSVHYEHGLGKKRGNIWKHLLLFTEKCFLIHLQTVMGKWYFNLIGLFVFHGRRSYFKCNR